MKSKYKHISIIEYRAARYRYNKQLELSPTYLKDQIINRNIEQ